MTTSTDSTARRVLDAIEHAERTIRWVADKADIPRSTMYRKLRGERDFTVREVAQIAHVLSVHPASLLPREFRKAAG